MARTVSTSSRSSLHTARSHSGSTRQISVLQLSNTRSYTVYRLQKIYFARILAPVLQTPDRSG